MRRTEEQFQTPEQVRDYLREALAVTEELHPPEDLRVVLFIKAAELISGKQVFFEQATMGVPDLRIPQNRRH